ncbi:MAG TPA: NHLP family bacteriocin export ABC transporter peptidase/permease/ATPase subunit [Gammaproteobacteria bacterium]|nr:NHLP family bacteriocin export ABC transporter peptidase/permease/ATPase subunit [Gammaproteobacteria bacterium]
MFKQLLNKALKPFRLVKQGFLSIKTRLSAVKKQLLVKYKRTTGADIVRVKTASILQMEATECGAAALGIILNYYGCYVPLEQLRIECGVSRDGSKAINMLRAARHYGLNAQGAKVEPEALSTLTFPLIAFWEFNHFVVIEGISETKVYLNDPATGPRTVTLEEFDGSFTGVVLLFETTPEFRPGGRKPNILNSIIPRLQSVINPLLFVTLASLALVIPGIAIPGFTKIFIDEILIKHLPGWLLPLLWGLGITAVLRTILSWLQQFYLTRLQLKMSLTSSARFMWHVLRLPMSFFSQRFAGDIQSRVAANDQVATWLSGDLATSLVSLVSMVFYALVMFLFDWQLTLIGIAAAAANVGVLMHVARKIENSSRRLQQELGKLEAIEMNGLQAIETIKATSAEDDFFQQWAGYHAKTLNSQQRIHLYNRTLQVLPQLFTGLLTVAILGLGSWRIMQGHLTIGGLVAFQSLLVSFNEPLMTLLGFGARLQEIRADLTRLEDVLNHPEDSRLIQLPAEVSPPSSSETEIPKFSGKLELRDVSFGYSSLDPPLLENINIKITPGQHVAVVGVSGGGKSTLARLICGLYQPWSGEILYDDVPIQDISAMRLSQSLGFVDQDIFLFEGTIHDNLTLWDHTITSGALREAIHAAALEPVIQTRVNGLDSEIENAGGNFSGGQRQQLEIARALASKPTLMVLDEATSSLDAETEQTIMENLKKSGHSLLIIAHRLSTIRDCDEIIVIDQGRIVERGAHEQLYQNKGAYYQLLQNSNEAFYAQYA